MRFAKSPATEFILILLALYDWLTLMRCKYAYSAKARPSDLIRGRVPVLRSEYAQIIKATPAAYPHNIAKALVTIATGLLSVALDKVTRPKLMVRPRRTTRASASTSDEVTARMKCVV